MICSHCHVEAEEYHFVKLDKTLSRFCKSCRNEFAARLYSIKQEKKAEKAKAFFSREFHVPGLDVANDDLDKLVAYVHELGVRDYILGVFDKNSLRYRRSKEFRVLLQNKIKVLLESLRNDQPST